MRAPESLQVWCVQVGVVSAELGVCFARTTEDCLRVGVFLVPSLLGFCLIFQEDMMV